MLDLKERTGTEGLDPLTPFNLFECDNAVGPSGPIPLAPRRYNQATSRARKTPHGSGNDNDNNNDNDNDNDSDHSTSNTADRLPPLLANKALARAVSQVQIPMDGWPSPHIFKLFVVLVKPPPDLDLSAIEGLGDYLTRLLVKIGGLVENGIRGVASRCWWILLGKCSTPNFSQI